MRDFHYHKCHKCGHVWGHVRPVKLTCDEDDALHTCPKCGRLSPFNFDYHRPTAKERAELAPPGVPNETPESEGSGT